MTGVFGSLLLRCERSRFASGRYFDAHGNLNNWWQTESARRFDQRAQCFVNQYARYHVGHQHIRGMLTLDENVQDNRSVSCARYCLSDCR